MKFDPGATSTFNILVDDEIPKYVTIEELQELLKEKSYQTVWDDYILGLKSKEHDLRTTAPDSFFLVPGWISCHLLVQTCMQDIEAYDWAKITEIYSIDRISEIVYIACNPYVWQPLEKRPAETIIQGRIATMQYDSSGVSFEWLDKMVNERVLFLADRRPTAITDTTLKSEGKVLKGMLFWNLIVIDGREYIKQFLAEKVPEYADTSIKYFSPESFRENIQYIAEERGGKIAIELVQQLRKDWAGIVTWKCFGIDQLKPEQVEKFRACLFEGMDYYIEQWKSDSNSPLLQQKETSFALLSEQCHKENKVEIVEAELRAACHGTAVALWKTIRTYEALGYLQSKNMPASKIYHAFDNYFGELPYNERNFRDARNKL